MKKVAFYTLGCKLNFSETSTLSRTFEERGYRKVDFTDKPDIFIINTCSVTENADKKCRKEREETGEGSKGKGILPIMYRNKIKTPELQQQLIKNIMDQYGKRNIIDLGMDVPAVIASFGENALEARIRWIGRYVFEKAKEAIYRDPEKRSVSASQLGGGGEDDKQREIAGKKSSVLRFGDDYDSEENKGLVRPEDFIKSHGIEVPAEQPKATSAFGALGGRLKMNPSVQTPTPVAPTPVAPPPQVTKATAMNSDLLNKLKQMKNRNTPEQPSAFSSLGGKLKVRK